MTDVQGSGVVITGAGSGIGQALAQSFGEAGARLFLVDLVDSGLKETLKLLPDGCEAHLHTADVREARQVIDLVDAAERLLGAVDIYINNAGVAVGNLLWAQSAEESDWVLDVNLRGYLHAIRTVVPRMIERGRGHIVVTASLAGLNVSPTLGAYTISKHAVVAASEVLKMDLELAAHDIQVSVLCPGPVPTNAHLKPGCPASVANAGKDPLVAQVEEFTGELMRNGMPPKAVADFTLAGVKNNDFWILPAKEFAVGVLERSEQLRAAIEG